MSPSEREDRADRPGPVVKDWFTPGPPSSSHEKTPLSSRRSADWLYGPPESSVNGDATTDGAASDGLVHDKDPNGNGNGNVATKGRTSAGTALYARDLLRSGDGSVGSSSVDGRDGAKWTGSRPSTGSMRPAMAMPNGHHHVVGVANGGPVRPTTTTTSLSSSSSRPSPDRPNQTPASIPSSGANPTTIQPIATPVDGGGHHPAIPHASVHRLSSPPIFRTSSPTHWPTSTPLSSFPSGPPLPPPLRHRHTLQVPKYSSARTSPELSLQAPNASDDVIRTAGGRQALAASGTRRLSLTLGRRTTRSIHSDLHVDDIPPDEEAVRWTETVRQRHTSRRRRKDDEDDGRVVMGTKVDQNHVNWVTAYNMLTGIRFTVSRTNAKPDRPLTEKDFHTRQKFSFDITGNELTPSAKYDFKFKDYAPWVFRHLRANFRLDPGDYLMSLTSKYILSELGSPGKSGSFFYFSRDYKYIIKTIHHSEHKVLRRILRDYFEHVQDHPNTLLSQFYGLHRVKIPYGKKIHFVVMNNLFPAHRDIHETFDLKGSTIGRDYREEDLEKNPGATMKDLNWLRRRKHLEFGPAKRDVFLAQVRGDVKLLQRLNIMDYSMLVGIHDLDRGNDEKLRDKTLQVFHPGGGRRGRGKTMMTTTTTTTTTTTEDDVESVTSMNMSIARTPSTLETARKARELRQMIKQEKPVRMDQSSSKMPDELMVMEKKDFTFYGDDGGFRATHEDDRPGEVIYYLGIIDCLTHYGTTKRVEHFWKGLSHPPSQISPIAPIDYGQRFVQFITSISKSREETEAEERAMTHDDDDHHHHHQHQHHYQQQRQWQQEKVAVPEEEEEEVEEGNGEAGPGGTIVDGGIGGGRGGRGG